MTKEEIFKLTSPEMLVELSHNEIIFISPNEEVVLMNPRSLLIRGLDVSFGYHNMTIDKLYSKGTGLELREQLASLEKKEELYIDLCTQNQLTKQFIYLETRIRIYRSDDKKILGYVIISHDVSSEVLARKELIKSQNYLQSIIQTASDGIIILDSDSVIQSVNTAAAKLFGYEPEEMEGQNIIKMMSASLSDEHQSYIRSKASIAKTIGIGREVVGIQKDGKTFPFRLNISKVIIERETFFTGIVHDLTEQKKAEAELIELNKDLEKRVRDRTEELADTVNKLLREVNERKSAQAQLMQSEFEIKNALQKEKELSDLKSRFISTASHEFRTPLAAIGLSASLIGKYNEENDKNSEKRHKHIERIQSNVNTITDILNDFLSLSRLEEGKLEHNPESIQLKDFSEEIINDLEGFKKPNQNIHYSHVGESVNVYLDSHLLKNVIINLLSNAVKYSKEDGDIYFQTEINANSILINVRDNGIGIPNAEQKFLFDRFFRAHNVSNIQGTGLGLNIVKQYVEIMKGNITFESTEGKGTKFSVRIPRK